MNQSINTVNPLQDSFTSNITGITHDYIEPPEKQFPEVDAGAASSFIDQAIVDHKIQTSVLTPMDQVTIAQTLHNPHYSCQDEIITVQIVYQNIKIEDGTPQKKRPQYAKCVSCESKQPLELFQGVERACDLCYSDMSKYYTCSKECGFACCAGCMLGFQFRRQLEEKTMEHNLVQLQYLTKTDSTPDQAKSQPNLYSEEMKVVDETISDKNANDPEAERIPWKQKHAIIGLWKRNNYGYNECYRQFRIDNPVTQKRFLGQAQSGNYEDFKLETLFYQGDKKGLFYFTQTQTSDLQGAEKKKRKKSTFHLQQFDISKACGDGSKLELYQSNQFKHRNLYLPPILGEKKPVKDVVEKLLSSAFEEDPCHQTALSPFEPQFFEKAKYLALTVKMAVNFSDSCPYEIEDTESYNIFFCRLDQPSKIDKVIYNGCIVLKVTMKDNQECSPITDVWYSCTEKLHKVAWRNVVDLGQPTWELTKENNSEQKLGLCYAFSGKTPREDKLVKKKLKNYLSGQNYFTQVQGIMHFDDQRNQRVSFLFTNLDFMTFQIDSKTNKAELIWENDVKAEESKSHSKFSDSRFCTTNDADVMDTQNDDRDLYICFNLQHKKGENDQDSFIIDYTNLKATLPNKSSIEFKINHLQMHDKFQVDEHNVKDKRLPYQFTDFRLQTTKDLKEKFIVSLHFVDCDTYQPNLYFLQGKKKGELGGVECKNQTFVRKQAATEYPILIQNTELPLQNQLLVANLNQNEPQKLIDIGDYHFICFVETGIQPMDSPFLENNQASISIFFLAHSPNGAIKLMQFQTFPWLTDQQNPEINSKESAIKIFEGSIPQKDADQTKIKGAALLYHQGVDFSDLKIKIAIQFYEEIVVYSLDNSTPKKMLNSDGNQLLQEKNAKIHMVCNKNMIFFVAGTNEDKLICVSQKGSDIVEHLAYNSSPCQILQLQVKQDTFPSEKEQSLYIIESGSTFKEIKCDMKSLNFHQIKTATMTRADNIIQKLTDQKWQKLALSSRSVSASFLKDTKGRLQKGVVTYNLTSQSDFKHDFLGYKADEEITPSCIDWGVNSILTNCYVFSVQHLVGIGKILLTVKEGNFCYYLLMQSLDNRRIDLFSHQPNQRELSNEVTLIRNSITAQMKVDDKILVFDHNFILKKQNFDCKTVRRTSTRQPIQIFQKAQSDYALIEKKIENKETGEFKSVEMILRINDNGRFTIIFQDIEGFIKKQLKTINKEFEGKKKQWGFLKRQLTNKSTQAQKDPTRIWEIKDCPPYTYNVKSNGRLVLFFVLEKKEKSNQFNLEDECTFSVVKYNLPHGKIPAEFQEEGINDLTEEEKNVDIYIIKHDSCKCGEHLFYLTDQFLIIQTTGKILFTKIKLINDKVEKQKANLSSTNTPAKYEGDPSAKTEVVQYFQGIKTLIESKECEFVFKCIDFSQMFSEKEHSNRFDVVVMSESKEIVLDDQKITDCIQISFRDITVIWDLATNQEIAKINNYSQFSTPETMIPTPFKIPTNFSYGCRCHHFNQVIRQSSDQNILLHKTDEKDQLFKLYTLLDLLEIKEILRKIMRSTFKESRKIDPETVLAFVHGRTFFQIFRDYPEVILSFLNQLRGVDDEVYKSRLFRTLKVKTVVEDDKDDKRSLMKRRYQSKEFEPPKKTEKNIMQYALENKKSLLLDALLQTLLLSKEAHIGNLIANFKDFVRVIEIQSQYKTVKVFMKKVFKTNTQTEKVFDMPWDNQKEMVVFGANNSHLSFQEMMNQAEEQVIQNTLTYLYETLISLRNKCKKSQNLKPLILSKNDVKQAQEQTKQTKVSFFERNLKEWKDGKKESLPSVPVTVKILEIPWLTEKNLKNFYVSVTCQNDETLFDLELIRVLLTCQDYKEQLILKAFLPYTIFMVAVLYYFIVCVNVPHTEGFFGGENVTLRCLICAYQFFFCGVEVYQIITLKANYLKDAWNYVYLLEYALTYFVIIEHSTNSLGLDREQMSRFTACSTILLWIIMFFWMRIFSFGWYVYLIQKTLTDIKYFLVLVLMVLITFANALYIFEIANEDSKTALSQPAQDEKETNSIGQLFQMAYDDKFIDSIVNQYLLGLGDYQYSKFDNNPAGSLIWSLFLLSTFLTQVTFMNMLIAIMGYTFGNVLAHEERYRLQQKTTITREFIYALKLSEMIMKKRYLYIIEPVKDSESEDPIISSISNIRFQSPADLENTKHSETDRENSKKQLKSVMDEKVTAVEVHISNKLDEKVKELRDQIYLKIDGKLELQFKMMDQLNHQQEDFSGRIDQLQELLVKLADNQQVMMAEQLSYSQKHF